MAVMRGSAPGQPPSWLQRQLDSPLRFSVYSTLTHAEHSPLAQLFQLFSFSVIVLSTITFCLETIPSIEQGPALKQLEVVDFVCLGFFTLEFLARLLCCPSLWDFARSALNIIDFVAIFPFYVQLIVAAMGVDADSDNTRIIRLIRLLRALRLLRLSSQ
ncbi:ion_trans domain-containing protein, partial [Haematococcus lacustris]